MPSTRYLVAVFAAALAASVPAQDNVLLVIADDFGVDAVNAYGESPQPPPTPVIDGLARRGVLFRNAWASAVCSPTRAGIMTGREAIRTGLGQAIPFANTGVLSIEEYTLPEVLDAGNAGIPHAMIGKWHLGDERNGGALGPNLAGFTHFAGMIAGGVHNYYDWDRTVDGVTKRESTYATTKIVDDAIAWISQQSRPWVCIVAFNAPHLPLHAPPSHLHNQNLAGKSPITDPIPFFHAMVEAMDSEIGRLRSSLGSQRRKTNIILVGDNGTPAEASVAPFVPAHAKATPYEGGVNVPLIVDGPIVNSGGREEDALVSTVDLFATVLELTNTNIRPAVPAWREIDSRSLVSYLTQANATHLRSEVYTETFAGTGLASALTSGFATVRDARHKVIRRYTAKGWTDELYDLVADPFERKDLFKGTLTPQQAAAHTTLVDVLRLQRSPTAASFLFGQASCRGSNGAPATTVIGKPLVSGGYVVQLHQGPANAAAILVTGMSSQTWGSSALPASLTAMGSGPGCSLYASLDLATLATTGASGGALVPVFIPNDPALVGKLVFHDWLVVDPAAHNNPLQLTTTNGIAIRMGF